MVLLHVVALVMTRRVPRGRPGLQVIPPAMQPRRSLWILGECQGFTKIVLPGIVAPIF